MKKYVVFVICLFWFVWVKADNPSLSLNCPKDNLIMDEKIVCDVIINSSSSISTISFSYDSKLSLSFIENNNVLNENENYITFTYANPLNIYDDVIFKIEVVGKNIGNEYINLENIKINDEISISDVTKKFNIGENKILSSNNKVEDITIDGISISNFDSNINRYENIIVNKPVVFIDVKGQDKKATVTGIGSAIVRAGVPKEVNIKIISEDGNVNIYTLVLTYVKEVVKSHDASLNTIELYNGDTRLDFVYDSEKTSFRIKIDSDISRVLVKATLNDSKAFFVSGYEPREVNLDYGENIVELRTESENGDTKIYSINIERSDDRSSDNTLKELLLNDTNIILEKDKMEYDIELPFEVSKTKIKAIANNKKAKVTYKDINLYEGNNVLIIKVTAENGQSKEYRINVFRESQKIEEEMILPDEKELSDEKETILNNNESDNTIDNYREESSSTNYYLCISLSIIMILFIIVFFIVIKRKKK